MTRSEADSPENPPSAIAPPHSSSPARTVYSAPASGASAPPARTASHAPPPTSNPSPPGHQANEAPVDFPSAPKSLTDSAKPQSQPETNRSPDPCSRHRTQNTHAS